MNPQIESMDSQEKARHTGGLEMKHATILITLMCNLKCKLCSAYSPYYKNSRHPSVEDVKEALKRFFQIVSHVDKFTICGGEPLIYPHLPEVLKFLTQYTSQIGLLEILTNGTIVPSDELLQGMKCYPANAFRVLVDNYGPDKSRKVLEIGTALTRECICHEIRNYTSENPHCGGWVDFGDLTTRKCVDQAEVEAKYAKCAYPQKLGFSFAIGPDGRMFACGPSRRCNAIGVVDDQREYVDLFDSTLTAEEQRQKIQAVLNGKSLKSCAYCNGLCEDSPRFVPAEQLDVLS